MGLDPARFSGIVTRFTSSDPLVLNADVPAIESIMNAETLRCSDMGITDSAPPHPDHSLNRAHQKVPAPQKDTEPPPRGGPPNYPPSKGVHWNIVQDLMKDNKQCGVCHSKNPFHWETGCPCAATIGKVLIDDDKASTEIMTKYSDHSADREKNNSARGGNSRRGGRGGGRGGPQPSPAPPTPPQYPAPHPQSPPPHRHSNFPNTQDLSSESDDDDGFEIEYGNNVDSAINIVPKPSSNSTIYSSPSFYHMPML